MNRTPLIELPVALTSEGARPGGHEPRWLLGVDGGATKTLAAVLDLATGRVRFGRAGPSNPDIVGQQAAAEALIKATQEALQKAGAYGEELDSAVLAVAATDVEPLARLFGERRPGWIVVNDVITAWAAATGGRAGIGVIAGTGSNVLGVGADQSVWRAGGWGHIVGDEGSGYWLAVQALKAALHDRDGSGPPTALGGAAAEFFEVDLVEEVPVKIFASSLSKDEIAAFARAVERVALAGDAVAQTLYEEGARELGEQIRAVIEHTNLRGAFPVGLIGSVFKAGPLFGAPLSRAILACAPEASVRVVEMAPVGGSLLLAARAAGCEQGLEAAGLQELVGQALARGEGESRP